MKAAESTLYLRAITLLRDRVPSFKSYPFSLPALRKLASLTFKHPVTIVIGENGMGKSTLLEAIAVAYGFNPEGGSRNFNFSTRSSHSELHKALRLVRGTKRATDGFFLRAESYFNVATEMEKLDAVPAPAPPIANSYGSRPLHEQSHGESFFALLLNRFHGRSFFVLDEPEAALSPTRQMALLVRIHQLVAESSQFIIATHSPIVMAYPGADLLHLSESGMRRVQYEETEHYVVMKRFVNDYPRVLGELLRD